MLTIFRFFQLHRAVWLLILTVWHHRHPSVYFVDPKIKQKLVQKHIDFLLNEKLSVLEHIDENLKNETEGVNLTRKMDSFLTISPFNYNWHTQRVFQGEIV